MKRPNILLIYTDQQRWDALSANRNPEIMTPNLDRLASEGVNFVNHFVQSPVCMTSRISLLTGQYPSTLGITHMGVPVPEETVTLPTLLQTYGYFCANIGKLHFLPHANRDHRIPHPSYDFDHLEIADEPGVYEDAYRAWVRRVAPDQLDHLSVGLPPATDVFYRTMGIADTVNHPDMGERSDFRGAIPFPGNEAYTHSAFVAEQTIAFLQRQSRSQPFLCIAGFYSPHAPWVVPQSYLDLYDAATLTLPDFPPEVEAQRTEDAFADAALRAARHGYYAMVTEVDHHVGRILDALEQADLDDNTIVLFTSDHGEWLGEHLKYGKGYPGDDAVSHVPLLMRLPGGPSATTIDQMVEAVDIVPTLLDAIGVQIPPHLQGESLLPLTRTPDLPGRESVLMEFTGWKTLRTGTYRYLIHADGNECLFDLRQPWGEYRDVSTDEAYAQDLADMRHRLLQRLVDAERPLPRIWPY
jgi:arylsulfatase A-like enzyme